MTVSQFDSLHGEEPPPKGLDQARVTFYEALATSAKFGQHAGNVKFITQTEVWTSVNIVIGIIWPAYLFVQGAWGSVVVKTLRY